MQVERANQLENIYHIVNQQTDLDKSQSIAQKEMTSIHIKMKNQSDSKTESQIHQANQKQLQQISDFENQIANNNKQISQNQKQGSQKLIPEQNKLHIYQQENSARGVKDRERNDNSLLNVINYNEYHKAQKQEIEMINNQSSEENGYEPLICPENKIINSKCSVDYTLFSLFYTLITVAGIILYIYSQMYWLIIVGATLYYLECLCTNFLELFEKTITENDFYNLYKNALADEPQIQFKVSAFIIAIRSKKKPSPPSTNITTNIIQQSQKGQQQAQPQQKPVAQDKNKKVAKEEFVRVRELVYSEQRSFDFSQHKDFSHPLQSQKEFFSRYGLIKIKPVIFWRCGNEETQLAYNKLQADLLEISKQRSDDIEKLELSYSIPFEDNNFIVKSQGRSSPLLFNRVSYFIFSLLFLSFPFRIYYLNTIKTLELYICKKVFI